jgi:DNA-binding MarR family transcriptional regulator
MTSVMGAVDDKVDQILRQWAHERPDLDTSPMGVLGRIMRASRHVDRELATVYKHEGLDFGLFDVLATLRRSGAPYRLSPTALNEWCMVTSGGMTARLDRLEEAGLIVRRPDPDDRRALLVELSPTGFAVIDKLLAAHLASEERLLASLSPEDREQLATLLRQVLIPLESAADRDQRAVTSTT